MIEETRMITQICVVVRDVRQANANWARVLGVPEEKIVTVFPDGILHYTDGKAAEYKDCQVALYQLDHLVLELIQPGPTPSPWGAFLEHYGQGVFHFCVLVIPPSPKEGWASSVVASSLRVAGVTNAQEAFTCSPGIPRRAEVSIPRLECSVPR